MNSMPLVNTKQTTNTIPPTNTTLSTEDAIRLMKAADANSRLRCIVQELTGAVTLGSGIISDLIAVEDVLWHASKYYDPEQENWDSEFFSIIRSNLDYEQKARMLFGQK